MKRYRVYIAGPISKGDLAENVNAATAAFLELVKLGFAPLCPHWSVFSAAPAQWRTFDREGVDATGRRWVESGVELVAVGSAMGSPEMTHGDWLAVDLPWVEVADVLLRLPGESAGADREVEHARMEGIPVCYSIADVVRWRAYRRELDGPPVRSPHEIYWERCQDEGWIGLD